jgi:hypothetical protein
LVPPQELAINVDCRCLDLVPKSSTIKGHRTMITANQFSVADVLGDAFVHEIPPYQRPYAWMEEQVLISTES